MRSLSALILALAATTVATVPYQEYVLAPSSRTVRPVSVFRQHGSSESEAALLDVNKSVNQSLVLADFNSSVTYDFGKNIAGLVHFNVVSGNGNLGFTFSESSLWVSSELCDATAPEAVDVPLVFNLTGPGKYESPLEKERGGFRYLTLVNQGEEAIVIDDLWVHFTAMPHWKDDELQEYTGWFHSNDDKLNRVWYAGAYTNQLVTIDPTRGNALKFLENISNPVINGTVQWWLNTTISEGTSVLTDGAKRDRLVWSGDMSIAVPGIAVTTFDLVSVRNALDSLFKLQGADGLLPYAGYPFNEQNVVSFTYHLYALIGVANFYHWSGEQAYLEEKWAGFKSGIKWATNQIDDSGLAYVTVAPDWLRFGMGGRNIEANSILFYTLNIGLELARAINDTSTADEWTQLANGIQSAALDRLWQPDVGLFHDNDTSTLAPQDGNTWAVKSGLVTSPEQVTQISEALQARWGPYGAPAPEARDAVSPFISGFELETHFLANRTEAGLELIRRMWADFMLDDPRMTNSTFIEGYSVSGELRYAPYDLDSRISHAHGWASGPTSTLTTFIGGIQILSEAGATWAIVPQLGDLTHVDAGFSTSLGQFSSKWSLDKHIFRLHIKTPDGTTGTVGLPIPDNHTHAALTSTVLRNATVQADVAGRYWIHGLKGGEYDFVVVGL